MKCIVYYFNSISALFNTWSRSRLLYATLCCWTIAHSIQLTRLIDSTIQLIQRETRSETNHSVLTVSYYHCKDSLNDCNPVPYADCTIWSAVDPHTDTVVSLFQKVSHSLQVTTAWLSEKVTLCLIQISVWNHCLCFFQQNAARS